MTLTHKRLSIVIAAAIALVIVLPLAATAAGPAYQGAKPPVEYELASLTGTADAIGSASASDGAVSAAATAEELVSPVGIPGTQIGSSTAVGEGWVFQTFTGLATGTYTVSVSMTIDPESAGATMTSTGLTGFSGARSFVVSAVQANPLQGGSAATSSQPVACSEGCPIPSTVNVSVNVGVPNGGDVYVQTGLSATAVTQGLGLADAHASGVITDISIAPAGAAPPPVQEQIDKVRVLVDSLTIDSRDAGTTSHVNLEDQKEYVVEALGTYAYSLRAGDLADAECSRTAESAAFQPNRFSTEPDDLLDLMVNGGVQTWLPSEGTAAADDPASVGVDESKCSTQNSYVLSWVGTGAPLTLSLNDAGLGDNAGSLTVNIYRLDPAPVPLP